MSYHHKKDIFKEIHNSLISNQLDRSFTLLDDVTIDLPIGKNDVILLKKRYEELKLKARIDNITRRDKEHFFKDIFGLASVLEDLLLQGRRIHTAEMIDFLTAASTFQNIHCPNCQSNFIEISERNDIQCSNCGASDKYFIPSPIQPPKSDKINYDQSRTIERLMLLCRHELILKNYENALNLCEQAIEIGFDLQEVWEYHALCYYYSTDNQTIINNNAKQILADLKTSKSRIVVPYQDSKSIREIIAKGLATAVKRQYDQIKLGDESQRAYLVKLMNIWQICYEIYPSDAFLRAILFELVGKGKLMWFEFNLNNYNLKNHEGALSLQFHPIKSLKLFLEKVFPHQGKITEYTEVIQLEVARSLSLQTYNQYFYTLRNNSEQSNYYKSNKAQDIEQIIHFLEKWERIFRINNNQASIGIAIQELSCKAKICWYELNDNGEIIDKALINAMGFSPFAKLLELCKLAKKNEQPIIKSIKNHLSKFILKDTIKYSERLEFGDSLEVKQLEMIEKICLDCYRCYLATDDTTYLELPLIILTDKSTRTLFYQLEKNNIRDNHTPTPTNFSLVAWLKQLCQLMKSDRWNVNNVVSDIYETLINHRYNATQRKYQQGLGAINSSIALSINGVELILEAMQEALYVFVLSDNVDHILWAVEELSGHKGSSITWIHQNKNSGITVNNNIGRKVTTDIYGLWEDLIFNIQTQLPAYQPPVLKPVPLVNSWIDGFSKTGNTFPKLR